MKSNKLVLPLSGPNTRRLLWGIGIGETPQCDSARRLTSRPWKAECFRAAGLAEEQEQSIKPLRSFTFIRF